MTPADAFRVTARRLAARPLESLLVIAGLAVAVGAIASTISLYQAVTTSLESGTTLREISVHQPELSQPRTGPVQRVDASQAGGAALTPEDIGRALASAPSVSSGWFSGLFSASRSGREVTAIIAGDYFGTHGLAAAEGTLFTPADEESGARVAVLGAAKARALFPAGSAVGGTVALMGLQYTVVGVLAPHPGDPGNGIIADELAFVPVRSSVIFEKMKSVPSLTFLAGPGADVGRAAAELRAWVTARFGPGAMTVEARLEEAAAERERIRGVLAVLLAFGTSGLVVAGVNVLNVLRARAARRVRSTGIEKALGASRGTVLALSVAEGAAIAVAGCATGLLAALGFNALLSELFARTGTVAQGVPLGPVAMLGSAGPGLLLVFLLSLSPALRAARQGAADAIRTE